MLNIKTNKHALKYNKDEQKKRCFIFSLNIHVTVEARNSEIRTNFVI